jgi:hypothetical protein
MSTKIQNMSLQQSKIILFLICYNCISWGQPLLRPLPFEDIYNGVYDFEMKEAKVKKKKSYFLMNESETSKTLYSVFEYNRGGYIVNQIFYNLKSGKEMYTAHYEYDKENYFSSCVEKVTKEIEQYPIPPTKVTNDNDFFYDKNGEPELMPADKDRNWIVRSIYQRDSMGNYKVKKYFHDGSFYKEKEHPFWERSPFMSENMYVNTNFIIDYFFSSKMYKTDTVHQAKDTMLIFVKDKFTNEITHRITKVRINNEFVIIEVDVLGFQMKLFFNYINSAVSGKLKCEINSIAYMSSGFNIYKCFLIHYFYREDNLSLNSPIELTDIFKSWYYNKNFLDGCFIYTYLKNGQKSSENMLSTDWKGMKKFYDIYYTNKNLIYQRVQYRASFGKVRSSKLFNHDVDEAVEINEYEYFD